MSDLCSIFWTIGFAMVFSLGYPAASAFFWICWWRFFSVHSSCEYPKSAGRWHAKSMIHATASSVISTGRPARWSSYSARWIPPALYLFRQSFTVLIFTSSRSAISPFVIPWDLYSSIFDRSTIWAWFVLCRMIVSSSTISLSVNASIFACAITVPSYYCSRYSIAHF